MDRLTLDTLAGYAARWTGRGPADYVYVVPTRGVWCLWAEPTGRYVEYTLIEASMGPLGIDISVLVDRDIVEAVLGMFKRALGPASSRTPARTIPTGESE